MWRTGGVSRKKRVDCMHDFVKELPSRFPNVKDLLSIAVTIPVTSCTPERTFSAMMIIKSRLRSEDRLNGLAVLYIHKDKPVHAKEVINKFARSNRQFDFALLKFSLRLDLRRAVVPKLGVNYPRG